MIMRSIGGYLVIGKNECHRNRLAKIAVIEVFLFLQKNCHHLKRSQ
jgi:hypothetical protein